MQKYIEKECQHHGVTTFIYEISNQRYKCKKCRSDNVSKRRILLKIKAVEYKGGKCIRCNYSKCISALEFHHLDPNQKDFSLSTEGNTTSWQKVQIELDKCVLLCANCHREEHAIEFEQKRDLLLSRQRKMGKTQIIECNFCKQDFKQKYSKQKYCSKSCSKLNLGNKKN